MGLLSAFRCSTRMTNNLRLNRLQPLLSLTTPLPAAPVTRLCSSYLNNLEPFDLFNSPKVLLHGVIPKLYIRNVMFSILIRHCFDPKYSLPEFKKGAVHAVCHISQLLANGQFDDMEGLVAKDIITKLRHRYMDLKLNENQRNWLAVNPKDCISKRCASRVISIRGQRFVEITVTAHGIHGLRLRDEMVKAGKKVANPLWEYKNHYMYIYRFIRNYTKGQEDSWTINGINHFAVNKANFAKPKIYQKN